MKTIPPLRRHYLPSLLYYLFSQIRGTLILQLVNPISTPYMLIVFSWFMFYWLLANIISFKITTCLPEDRQVVPENDRGFLLHNFLWCFLISYLFILLSEQNRLLF